MEHWGPGEPVLKQGEQSAAIYLLVAGSLQLGKYRMHVGSWFGESGALFGGAMQAAVIAAELSVCAVFPKACFDALPARLLGWLRAAHPEGRSAEHSMQLPELPQADQAVRQSASQVPSRRQSRAVDLALISR